MVVDPGIELTRTDAVCVSESAERELGLADESYSEYELLGVRFRIHGGVLVLGRCRCLPVGWADLTISLSTGLFRPEVYFSSYASPKVEGTWVTHEKNAPPLAGWSVSLLLAEGEPSLVFSVFLVFFRGMLFGAEENHLAGVQHQVGSNGSVFACKPFHLGASLDEQQVAFFHMRREFLGALIPDFDPRPIRNLLITDARVRREIDVEDGRLAIAREELRRAHVTYNH